MIIIGSLKYEIFNIFDNFRVGALPHFDRRRRGPDSRQDPDQGQHPAEGRREEDHESPAAKHARNK